MRISSPRLLALFLLACLLASPPLRAATADQTVPVIKLGKVTVHGQKVIQALQAIKIALQQPVSSDPKLANVVVCRIHNAIGSHLQQILTCGTNATLLKRKDEIQRAMTTAFASETGDRTNCDSEACYTEVFGVLNEVLSGQNNNGILNSSVNGLGLRSLLEKLPAPVPAQATLRVAASPENLVSGEGQNEALQLGGIRVTGQAMIQKILETVKAGLQQPFSNDPGLADVVVCRLNAEQGNQSDSVLTCATNRVWSSAQGALQSIKKGAAVPIGDTSCSAGSCQAAVFAPFNLALTQLPGRYLQVSVQEASLHALLEEVT